VFSEGLGASIFGAEYFNV